MFIVPFLIRDVPKSILQWNLQPISLFLENRGRGLCSTDVPEEWLDLNGIHADDTWIENDTVYVKVNPLKTNLSEFYSFEQLTKLQTKGTEECWRTFFLLQEPNWDGLLDSKILKTIEHIRKRCMP